MPAHFGLDLSDSSIKIAQAIKFNNDFELEAFGEVKTPVSFQNENKDSEVILINAIKKLIKDSQIHNKYVYISLPETSIYSSVIQMPVLSDTELDTALKFEAEQYIPIPLNEVSLQSQILYKPEKDEKGKKMDVLIVAAKKTILDRVIRICEQAEISPIVVENSLLSSIRSLEAQIGQNSLLIDCGDTSTNIAIIQDGVLKQISSINIGGQALTRSIMQNLAIPEQQAKQYKHAYGLENDLLEGKIARSLAKPIENITNHIIKNIRFANNLDESHPIAQVILTGGTSLLPNFSQYLVEQLNLEVNLANPLVNCRNTNLPEQLLSSAPRFSSVIGLAIRD